MFKAAFADARIWKNLLTAISTLIEEADFEIATDAISNYSGFGISCNGSSDGFINTTASGGTGNLTYTWTGPSSFSSTVDDIAGISNFDDDIKKQKEKTRC
jgi:hypothetical protein